MELAGYFHQPDQKSVTSAWFFGPAAPGLADWIIRQPDTLVLRYPVRLTELSISLILWFCGTRSGWLNCPSAWYFGPAAPGLADWIIRQPDTLVLRYLVWLTDYSSAWYFGPAVPGLADWIIRQPDTFVLQCQVWLTELSVSLILWSCGTWFGWLNYLSAWYFGPVVPGLADWLFVSLILWSCGTWSGWLNYLSAWYFGPAVPGLADWLFVSLILWSCGTRSGWLNYSSGLVTGRLKSNNRNRQKRSKSSDYKT
jgi:hypothetical protein